MQAIVKPDPQVAIIYLFSTAEGDLYLKELWKDCCEKKEVLPTVQADSVLDIFAFTQYDI